MSKCSYCGEKYLSFPCPFCEKYFCNEHLPPHKHYCTHISTEDTISEIADKATPSETLLDTLAYIARIVKYTALIVVIVLSFDAFVLAGLSLMDVNTWLTILWYEGFIMMVIGSACWWWGRERGYPLPVPNLGYAHHRIKLKAKYPWFWVSVGMAGLALIFVGSLIWQLH